MKLYYKYVNTRCKDSSSKVFNHSESLNLLDQLILNLLSILNNKSIFFLSLNYLPDPCHNILSVIGNKFKN